MAGVGEEEVGEASVFTFDEGIDPRKEFILLLQQVDFAYGKGEFEKCISLCARALLYDSDVEEMALRKQVRYSLVKAFVKLNRIKECLKVCDEILEMNPGDSIAMKCKEACLKVKSKKERRDNNNKKLSHNSRYSNKVGKLNKNNRYRHQR